MFQAMRRRFNATGLVAVLALVFSMGGGAYAASRYVITSTKQISPKVLKALQGKAGASGVQGAAGPAGPAGPQGASGGKGENGTNGTNGSNGTNGMSVTSVAASVGECTEGGTKFTSASGTSKACNGKEGKEGSPWTAGGILPADQTEKGSWSIFYVSTAAYQMETSAISFTIPLKAEPEAHYIKSGENLSAPAIIEGKCKGNYEDPEAAPGNLCIFVSSEGNAQQYYHGADGTNPVGYILNPSANGAAVVVDSVKEGEVIALGNWAVTG